VRCSSTLALLLITACSSRPEPSAAEEPAPAPPDPVPTLDPGEADPVVAVDYDGDQATVRYRGAAVATGAVTLRVGFDGKVERPGTHEVAGTAGDSGRPTGRGGPGGAARGAGGGGRGGPAGGAGRGAGGGGARSPGGGGSFGGGGGAARSPGGGGGFGGGGAPGGVPTAWVLDQPMQLADGVATATLALPADTRALSMSFVGADGRADDNAGEDYHSGVLFPYIGPFLTPGSDGGLSTNITVTWESDRSCKGVVLYGDDPEHLDHQAIGVQPDTIHHVELTGLTPGATVHYQVSECGTGRRSEVAAFHTIPDDATALDVAVMADMQDKGMSSERWGEVAARVQQAHSDVDLILAPGDLAGDDEPRFWWLFFDRARDLFATTPLVPAVGNHDTPGRQSSPDDSSFLRYFPVPQAPGAGGVYATHAGPLVVLTLNSEVPSELQAGGAQYRWVEQQLSATPDSDPWIFAQWHVPPFNAGGRFAGVQDDTRPVTTLFDGRLDWVFTGHEHLYQRSFPLRAGQRAARYGRGDDDGVGYIVTPTAGDRIFDNLAPQTEPSRQLVSFPQLGNRSRADGEHGYLIVHIDGPGIHIESWGMGRDPGQPAAVVDELQYQR